MHSDECEHQIKLQPTPKNNAEGATSAFTDIQNGQRRWRVWGNCPLGKNNICVQEEQFHVLEEYLFDVGEDGFNVKNYY